MFQQDSTYHVQMTVGGDSAVATHRPLTPAQVLRWLPRDATPAQQDSAIQAHFQPDEIRWSARPDTLHLPGHDKGHNMLDVDIPQYYREGFFSNDTLFHPELKGGRYGVAGDPVPYAVHSDNFMTGLLLVSFLMALVAYASVKDFISRQLKSLFNMPYESGTDVAETATEMRFQGFLMFVTTLLFSLLFYFFTLHHIGDSFILKSQYYLILIYFGIIVVYFLLKVVLYTVVNLVFFDGKRNGHWLRTVLFLMTLEGVLLFPAVMVLAYFDFSIESVEIYFIIVLLSIKLLTFYKCYVIFFRRNVVELQIILYFCALEIVPALLLWGTLYVTASTLKINF